MLHITSFHGKGIPEQSETRIGDLLVFFLLSTTYKSEYIRLPWRPTRTEVKILYHFFPRKGTLVQDL